jgi:cobalt-zinc-cadmium efflux system protein
MGWDWIDSVVAILIGLWVLPRSWSLLKSSLNILLEGVPENIALEDVRAALRAVPGVQDLHDLHVWALTSGKVSLTVHVVTDPAIDAEREVLPRIREKLAHDFGITHVTVQCERTPCHQADEGLAEHFRAPEQVAPLPPHGPRRA